VDIGHYDATDLETDERIENVFPLPMRASGEFQMVGATGREPSKQREEK
jgi:hypothetical protein